MGELFAAIGISVLWNEQARVVDLQHELSN